MELQSFKEKLYERMWKIEGIMNELKNYHDLKRAQYRGLKNTQYNDPNFSDHQNLKI